MRLSSQLLFYSNYNNYYYFSIITFFSSLATINQTYIKLYIFCNLPFIIYFHFEQP